MAGWTPQPRGSHQLYLGSNPSNRVLSQFFSVSFWEHTYEEEIVIVTEQTNDLTIYKKMENILITQRQVDTSQLISTASTCYLAK